MKKHCKKNCEWLNIGISNAGCDKYDRLLNFDDKGFLRCGECLMKSKPIVKFETREKGKCK